MSIYTDKRREIMSLFFPTKENMNLPLDLWEEITDMDVTEPAERLEAIAHIIMRLFPDNWKDNGDRCPGYDYENQTIVNAYDVPYEEGFLTGHILQDLRHMKEDIDLAIETLEAIEKYNQFPETPD